MIITEPRKDTTMIETTLYRLNEMRLYTMVDKIRHLREAGRYASLGQDELLAFVVDAEYDTRHKKKIDRLLNLASLKMPSACIEDINFSSKRNLLKEHLEPFINCDYIRQHKNILLSGLTGCGKTYLACALGHHACLNAHSVKYFRVSKFLETMNAEQAVGNYLKAIDKIGKTELLILDDLGPDVLTRVQRNHLMEVIEERYLCGSTIVASQLPFEQCYDVFGESTSADAICDRLFHNGYKLKLEGDSLRKNTTKNNS